MGVATAVGADMSFLVMIVTVMFVIVVHKNLKKKIYSESNGGKQKPDVSINLMELVSAGHN